MKRILGTVRVVALVLVVAALGAGCFFGTSLEVNVIGGVVFISTTAFTEICTPQTDPGEYDCTYFGGEKISRVTLTDIELAAKLSLLDPLIVQLPAAASDFAGSFLHQDSGVSGNLAITSGLAALDVDATRRLTAEPGTQLVVIDLPDGAPQTGTFAFNFNFRPPPGTTALPIKAMFTGKVVADGRTFYPPLFPCETDMANVPSVVVPLPAGGLISFPVDQAQGCDNEVYAFGPSGGAPQPVGAISRPDTGNTPPVATDHRMVRLDRVEDALVATVAPAAGTPGLVPTFYPDGTPLGIAPFDCHVNGLPPASTFACFLASGAAEFSDRLLADLALVETFGPLAGIGPASALAASPDGSTVAMLGPPPSPSGPPTSVALYADPRAVPSAAARAVPRQVVPPAQAVSVPGAASPSSTQTLAFDPITGRSHVCTAAGISVVDPPYAALDFTVPLEGCAAVATAPDGSLVAAVNLTGQMFVYPGPLSPGTAPQILDVAGDGTRLQGVAFARDGSRIVAPALDTPHVYLIHPPYGSGSTVEKVTLPAAAGWEDVAFTPDNQFVVGAGAPDAAGSLDPVVPLGRFPFAPADFSTLDIPGGRGAGSVRFAPEAPCPALAAAQAPAAAARGSISRQAGDPVPLVAAVLPLSRSVRVGCPATAFVSVINAGTERAIGVALSLATPVPAAFMYQTTDPSDNSLNGSPNTPVDIEPGQVQTFLVAFVPTAPFPSTEVALEVAGTNTAPAPSVAGVNRLRLAAAPARTGDAIALAVTAGADGIVDIPGPDGTGAFAVASVNVGINALLTVSADTGEAPGAALSRAVEPPLAGLFVCQTDTATGECLAPPAPSVTTPVAAAATPSFAVFAQGNGVVPFDPAGNRIFVRFRDALGAERGSTSVAVRTE